MGEVALDLELADERATTRLGMDLAAALRPGDIVALEGDLGAGKTSLARAIIRSLACDPHLDVPSPTFTLVQAYDGRLPVYHFDLYRLAAPDELDELGLEEASETGLVLMEWPQQAGQWLPADRITITLVHHGTGRRAAIAGPRARLERIARSLAVRSFLDEAGWGDARRCYLIGDASARIYETVSRNHEADRILMNAPRAPGGPAVLDGRTYPQIAHLAESVVPFVAVACSLREQGFAAPRIYAQRLDEGLLLMEHLGTEPFLDDGRPVPCRYLAAAALLAEIHVRDWPRRMPVAAGIVHEPARYDRAAMLVEVALLIDWYLPWARGEILERPVRLDYQRAWNEVVDQLEDAETSLVLRDFHSPNIVWRKERNGRDRLGLLDFQDAVFGPAAYDVAALAQDARVTIPQDLQQAVIDAYCQARSALGRPFDRTAFEKAFAIAALQRASKILGLFVRLDRRDGKPQYLAHLPRIRTYIGRVLHHRALAPLQEFYRFHHIAEGTAA